MYAQIAKAISSGFTSRQIIDHLLKKFPDQSSKIKDALAAGFTVDQVVTYLGGGKKALNRMSLPQETSTGVNTEFAKTQQKDINRSQMQNKYAMAAGSAAVGGLGAGMATKALSRALPTNLLEYGQNTLQQPQSNPLTSQSPMGPGPTSPGVQVLGTPKPNAPPQQMPGTESIPQPQSSAQPILPQRDIKKSVDLIKNIGEEQRVKNLIDGGLPPKDIAGVLRKLLGKDKLQALEASEGGLEAAIEDYAQSTQQQPQELAPMESPSQELDAGQPGIEEITQEIAPQELNLPEETIEPSKPIEKNQTVVTPHGIGEVKEIRNGKAVVEVDGKKHQVNEADLQPTTYTDEDIADTYDKMMGMIPESERSGFISWAGYDENRKVLGYIPRGGNYEELSNITPEEAEIIKTGKGIARTSGKNTEGMWVVGGDTRGLISQIQHDRRRKRESEEKKQLKLFDIPKPEKQDRGMKPLYDEMAYPRGLSEARIKKAKDEARAKKKQEKEDEKERIKRKKAAKRKKQP